MPDLWPDDITKVVNRTPVTILREQASLLGQKTKNIVKAKVEQADSDRLHEFNYRFYLVAPALQDYHFKLFDISHNIELYPVLLSLDDDIANNEFSEWVAVEVQDEKELLDTLKRIFAARKTRRVISSILGQSQETHSDSDDYRAVEDVNDIPF